MMARWVCGDGVKCGRASRLETKFDKIIVEILTKNLFLSSLIFHYSLSHFRLAILLSIRLRLFYYISFIIFDFLPHYIYLLHK
jgi:hypothetical protein